MLQTPGPSERKHHRNCAYLIESCEHVWILIAGRGAGEQSCLPTAVLAMERKKALPFSAWPVPFHREKVVPGHAK